MADDTPNIDAARHALEEAIIENSAQVRCDGAYPTLIPTALIDKLIAAVRAEQAAEIERLKDVLRLIEDGDGYHLAQDALNAIETALRPS